MNRRDFIRGSVANGLKLTGIVAATASQRIQSATKPGRDKFLTYIDVLEDRVDRLEKRHARLLKATIIIAGISTGIDLSLIL